MIIIDYSTDELNSGRTGAVSAGRSGTHPVRRGYATIRFHEIEERGEEEEEEEEGKEGGIKEKTNGINLKSNVARSVARLLHPFSLSIEFFISDFCFDLCILPARTLTFRHSMSPPSLPSPPLPPRPLPLTRTLIPSAALPV